MTFLSKQIHFISSFKKKLLAGFILGVFLSMLIIFLEPFNTNEYESNNRIISLLGFGALLSCVFIIQSIIENIWYYRVNKIWLVSYEILSTIIFFIFSGTIIYLYNHLIINDLNYSIKSHWWYYSHIVLAMVPIVAPLIIYLRQKFGQRIIPNSPTTIIITGENKNETFKLQKNDLLYIQAVENYIEIFFVDQDKELLSKTFRQTLSKVHEQVSFLEKCHRSYLVNINNIKEIRGNSQSAKIHFQHVEKNIPLSKTLYKSIKSRGF